MEITRIPLCDSKINPNFQQNKEKFTEPILKDDDTTSTSTVASFHRYFSYYSFPQTQTSRTD